MRIKLEPKLKQQRELSIKEMITMKTQSNQNQILNPLKKIASPKQKTQPKKMKLKNDWKKSMEGQMNIKEIFRNFPVNKDRILRIMR